MIHGICSVEIEQPSTWSKWWNWPCRKILIANSRHLHVNENVCSNLKKSSINGFYELCRQWSLFQQYWRDTLRDSSGMSRFEWDILGHTMSRLSLIKLQRPEMSMSCIMPLVSRCDVFIFFSMRIVHNNPLLFFAVHR